MGIPREQILPDDQGPEQTRENGVGMRRPFPSLQANIFTDRCLSLNVDGCATALAAIYTIVYIDVNRQLFTVNCYRLTDSHYVLTENFHG